MAKEPTQSRLPMPGVSRIPLPGLIRPPSVMPLLRPSQLRAPSAFTKTRPGSFSGLRPPTTPSLVLKKSSSGDRINNINSTMNLVGKKTTTALKKLFTKPPEVAQTPLRKENKAAPKTMQNETMTVEKTPRPLTRSDTFVRSADSPETMLVATPMPVIGGDGRRAICESTPLLSSTNTQGLYVTQTFDCTFNAPFPSGGQVQRKHNFESTRLSTMGFGHTMDIDSPKCSTRMSNAGFGQTINMELTRNSPDCKKDKVDDATQVLSKPNATRTLNKTHSIEDLNRIPSNATHTIDKGNDMETTTSSQNDSNSKNKTITLEDIQQMENIANRTMDGGQKTVEDNGSRTPASNATYSNPGSTENLLLLDDVSIPSGFEEAVELDAKANLMAKLNNTDLLELTNDNLDDTLKALAPNKATMKLPLNSTMNTERLLDLTQNITTPAKHMQLLNLTKDYMDTPNIMHNKNTTQLLYMTQVSSSCTTTPDRNGKKSINPLFNLTPIPQHLLSPMQLKQAQSDLVLPTRTPDEESSDEPMDVDSTMIAVAGKTNEFFQQVQKQPSATSLQDVNNPSMNQKGRFSFGLDLTESTLDCSIELVDVSLSSTVLSHPSNNTVNNLSTSLSSQQLLKKQNSFDMDESLGILTPDQMKEFLDSTATNNTNNNLDIPLMLNVSNSFNHKLAMHQMRIDQTPSPEELPLDPVEVKTDINEMVLQHQQHQYQLQQQQQLQQMSADEPNTLQNQCTESLSLLSETEPSKSESITKSNVSKISTSFITSVTSVTSLDTGYQGDGEMSRPASRGACDHSPSNGPLRKGVSRQPSFNQQQGQGQVPVRRQDPMTDSDFFTESDADDIFHRGDRRAQVIDGQLYGPMLQPSASVFISEDPQMEDSCMESSGIFTDVENRGDEDLAQIRRQNTHDETQDLSPDLECDADSTETVRSNRESSKRLHQQQPQHGVSEKVTISSSNTSVHSHGQGHLSSSQTSSTIQSSMSTDRLSAATLSNRTSYCSVDGGGANAAVEFKSFSSLDEAFGGGDDNNQKHMPVKLMKSSTTSTTSWCEQPPIHKHLMAVQNITSPRKQHSSLTSLCSAEHTTTSPAFVNCQSSAQSITDSDRSFSCATTTHSNASNFSSHSSPPNAGKKQTKTANQSSPGKYTPRSKTTTTTATPKSAKSLKLSPNSGGSGGAKNSSPPAVRKYHHSPNKWDAVMNQIANNKAHIRKNYSDVKSKVSTRILVTVGGGADGSPGQNAGNGSGSPASISPTVRRSPTNNSNRNINSSISKISKSQSPEVRAGANNSSSSPKALDNKRLIQNVNRGRSYSKDSQKSSQSDLSFASGAGSGGNTGSPKLLAKTPLRAAKKRDVRNLSISPTDLGPPPKTQQTSNGSSTRPKPAVLTLTQKRFNAQSNSTTSTSPSTTSTAASSPTGGSTTSIKGSPPLKKFQLNTRRLDTKTTPIKTPLKDHNRIINQTITPPSSKSNSSKPETPTDLQENGISIHNNNNNIGTSTAAASTTAAAITEKTGQNIRTNSRTSSPVLTAINNKKSTPASSPAVPNHLSDKKLQNKLHNTSSPASSSTSNVNRKLLLHKQHQQLSDDVVVVIPSAEPAVADELQQLKLLNRHSCNGALNYEAFEQQQLQLQQLQQQSAHQTKSTEALGVLLQYLVYDLDAFSCPSLRSENAKIKDKLKKTLLLLDEAKSTCSELQDQLCDKDAFYIQRENELQALHRCELDKARSSLEEFEGAAKQQISALQSQLENTQAEYRNNFDSYRNEMELKVSEKSDQIKSYEERENALQQRLKNLEISDRELRDRLTQMEDSCSKRLQQSAEREFELMDRIKSLTKELDRLKTQKESNERDLKDKLNLSNDEIAILRTTRRSLNESGVCSPRNTSSCSAVGNMELSRLQNEIESLRCVLELKQKEISKLTKQNEELLRDADEKLALQAKISLLESKNEMLLSEMEIKSEKEKEYLRQIDEIQKAFNHETVKRTRLSYDNEALQWQLKQRSEQLHIVETKLHELSSHEMSSTSMTNRSSSNGSALNTSLHMDDISPPSSPVIKGVIEKTDSVSWVLEMDDETPEAAATKMVKRAGSFRSVERSSSMRKQLSVSASAGQTFNNSLLDTTGPNPLSQSMSATSVIREHSKVETNEFNNRLHPRIRSKSVSVKGCEALQQKQKSSSSKLSRQLSSGNSRKSLEPADFKEPLTSSSPFRPRSSTLKIDNEQSEDTLFRRSSAKLITCDTSALNKGERLEMRSLPSHPSVQDLKVIKKCQEIQESAGEAMVSGTNSEDESCSASSDDVVSTASSSANSDSTNSSNQLKNARMSIEDVLLMEKMNSLSGTPMEVSWSEDADGLANSSTL
ncbi:toucan [Musca autumnalis]|uniref:toucan n=1 Tax=Musca autumnalis TaxID=221902 RepID=UPI003CEAEFD4